MPTKTFFLVILWIAGGLWADEIRLSGRLVDVKGNPVSGVVVSLKQYPEMSDTTGPDGKWVLTNAMPSALRHSGLVAIRDFGTVESYYNMLGQRVNSSRLAAGVYADAGKAGESVLMKQGLRKTTDAKDSLVVRYLDQEAGRVEVSSLYAGPLPAIVLYRIIPLAEPVLALLQEKDAFYGLVGQSVQVSYVYDEALWRPVWLLTGSDTNKSVAGKDFVIRMASAPEDSLPVTLGLTTRVQTLTFNAISDKTYGDSDVELAVKASSGLTVVLSTEDETACSLDEVGIKILAAGECRVHAEQAGNMDWNRRDTSITFQIQPRILTLPDLEAADKIYDGDSSASLLVGALNGVVDGDDVQLKLGEGHFVNKAVGESKTVNLKGFSLSGSAAANYRLEIPATLTAAITAKELTLSGFRAQNKIYSGNTQATLSGGQLSGILDGDVVILNDLKGVFASRNAGKDIVVSLKEYALSGSDAANYVLKEPESSWIADITPKPLTATVTAKEYDGNRNAELKLTGMIAGDVVLSEGTFESKDVGTAIPVSAMELTGKDAGNYQLTVSNDLTGSINARTLTLSGLQAEDRKYDGTVAAILTTPDLQGVVAGDSVGWVMGTGVFANKNVGTDKMVSLSGFALSGADQGNYRLNIPADLSADIVPETLTLAGLTASDKIYDGTTDAELSAAILSGVLAGDAVELVPGSGHFAGKDAGPDIAVTLTDFVLQGDDAANYILSGLDELVASIAPKALAVTAKNKVYDGSTQAELTLSGNLAEDDVSVVAHFVNRNAGADVEIAELVLQGASAGNYSLEDVGPLRASITTKALTATALDKVYDGTQDAVLTLTGVVSGDTVIGKGLFARKKVGTNIGVTGLILSGAHAGNYRLESSMLSAVITARPLTVAVKNKEYDATPDATLVLTGMVSGDDVTGSALFADKAVGTGIAVTNLVLDGADADNYSLAEAEGLTGNVTQRTLTASVNTKVYDGTTAATLLLTGMLDGDDVTGTGTFAKEDVAADIAMTNLTLAGADKGNYRLATTSGLTGTITARPVTVSAITGALLSKIYDSTTAVPRELSVLEGTHYQLNNVIIINNEKNVDIDITSMVFNSANVPDANRVILQYSGLKKSNRKNYSIEPGTVDIPARIEQATPVITVGVPPKLSPANRASSLSSLVTIKPLTGGVVTYSSETPDICSVTSGDGVATALVVADADGNYPAGVCKVRVSQAVTRNYQAVYNEILVPFKGTVKDTRDGQTYATVQIGTQTWMAQNLNYTPVRGSSWCYSDNAANCTTYGRLYDWATAMNAEVAYNSIFLNDSINNPGLCPEGWHVPRDSEWETLVQYADLTDDGLNNGSVTNSFRVNSWYSGTDRFGFSALPGGYRYSDGSFGYGGGHGSWWSATEYSSTNASRRYMPYGDTYVRQSYASKEGGYSMRCIKD